jgi:hypothetical protein
MTLHNNFTKRHSGHTVVHFLMHQTTRCGLRTFFLPTATSLLFLSPALYADDVDDIMDIRGPQVFGFWETNGYWAIPAIILALAILGLILYFVLRKKPEAPLSPYQRAQIALGEASALISNSDDKTFSIAVSDALRQYLEGAFSIRAPEQTTEEFLQYASKDKRISEEALSILSRFLSLCDLAKFARHAFGTDERQELLDTARRFVDEAHRQRLNQLRQPAPPSS